MSIVNITDRERELEKALAEEQRLNGMGAEREYVLQGQVAQLTRKLDKLQNKLAENTRTSELLIEGANASAMRAWTECDELKAQLGDLPESQAAMLQEIKVLRDALESYANPSNWDEDFHGVRRKWLEPASSTRNAYAGYDLASAALTRRKS